MADEADSPLFFPQPAYALIIGISEYQHSQPAGDRSVLEPENFRALNFAAKDADDFATFLKGNGFVPDNVAVLLNEKATAKNIKIGFKKLSDACRDSGANEPLVVVYFSGHGYAENEEKHYLVPYEGERDVPYATAIPNEEFNLLLEGLPTHKLVVFLDACHSGGLVGVESKDAKGQEPVRYDFARGLGGGDGRYVIASCGPKEESYESDGNGIFTGKLLELLGGKSPHFASEEEIGIFALYPKLRDEVKRTADQRHKQPQVPRISEVKDGTDIVLAINQRARRARENREREDRERREDFLAGVTSQLNKMMRMSTRDPVTVIAWKLQRYVREDSRVEGHDPLYRAFDENLGMWRPGAEYIVVQCCDMLLDVHKQVIDALFSEKSAGSAAKPLDTREPAARSSLVGPPSAPPPPIVSDQPVPRRTGESDLRMARFEKNKE